MLTPSANFHHSKLPSPGVVGYIAGLSTVDPQRKCIVCHYPLCDNVLPYSLGIHTVYVRFLDNHEIMRVSGVWFRAALP
jgi:hypothetical protein